MYVSYQNCIFGGPMFGHNRASLRPVYVYIRHDMHRRMCWYKSTELLQD